jgi:hypothetical protein
MSRSTLAERMDRAGIVIPDTAAIAGLGGVAIVEGAGLQDQSPITPSLGLTAFHDYLLLVASVGATKEEAAEVFSCEVPDIERARDEINKVSGVETMAASVSKAIVGESIPLTLSSERRRINNQQLFILHSVAAGRTNPEIGRKMSTRRPETVRKMMGLWYNLGASGRTEGIRRAYEFELDHQPRNRETIRLSPAMEEFLRVQAAVRQRALANQ